MSRACFPYVSYTESDMLPPSLPTSFVPHSAGAPARRFRTDFTGAFGFFAYTVLGIVFALALGVFFYGRILASSQSAKDAALARAEATIDPVTVANFVRLRDRLDSGTLLLANHSAPSGFFALIETLLPATVRFTSLHLALDEAKAVKLEGSGVAKSFNALAVASTAFAADGRIKDAIFSNIVVTARDGSVLFTLAATLDPALVAFSPSAPVAPVSAAQGSSATATSTVPAP